jgi:hypothetical protein
MRYCIGCQHLYYTEPDPGSVGSTWTGRYGEEDAALFCRRGHWRHDFDRGASVETFERCMEKANTCPDYEERNAET